MKRAPTRIALIVAALSVVFAGARAQDRRLSRDDAGAERRMALVVGNDTYRAAPLANARNDARAIAAALREVGFTVSLVLDANRAQFGSAVDAFGKQLRADDVALFFYAGHGLQLEGTNYLVPVDYNGQDEAAARWNTVPLGLVQDTLRRAKVALLVLDACRNNPYLGTRAAGGGLAAPSQARGSLIAFAAEAGQTASDAPGGTNGLFTANLLQVIRTPGLGVREVFRRVRERVVDATNAKQFPAVYEALTGDFVFRPERAPAPNPTPPPPNPAPPPPNPTPKPVPPPTPVPSPGTRYQPKDPDEGMFSGWNDDLKTWVTRTDVGATYKLDVEFTIPPQNNPRDVTNLVKIYRYREQNSVRSADFSFPPVRGNWKPGARVTFSVQVPKEMSDPTKGWQWRFCAGDKTGCRASANLLRGAP